MMIMNKEGSFITSERELFDYIEDNCGLAVRRKFEEEEIAEEKRRSEAEIEWEMIADDNLAMLQNTLTELEAIRDNLQKNTKRKTEDLLNMVIDDINNNV